MFLHFLHLSGVPKVVSTNVLLHAPLLVVVYQLPLSGGVYNLPISLW